MWCALGIAEVPREGPLNAVPMVALCSAEFKLVTLTGIAAEKEFLL
jgi:hypothetical protein